MTWTERNFPALSNQQFTLLFISTTLSQLAFGMMSVVQGIVAFDLTGRNSAVGLVSLGMGISMLFIGPIGGTLSDRMSKRKLLLSTQLVIGTVFGLIGVLIILGLITIWALVLSTLTMGVMFAVMGPTRQAWVGDLLDGDDLSNGIALQQLMQNATRIVGPLAAGIMVALAFIGTGGTYVTMAAIFVLVLVMLSRMDDPPLNSDREVKSVLADLADGASYIWHEPQIRLYTLVFVGMVLGGFSYQTIMPGFLENQLGMSTDWLGPVYMTTAVGGIVTTIVLAMRPPFANPALPMFFCGGVLAAALFVFSMVPNFVAALAVAVFIGAASSGFQLLNNVNLMERSHPDYFGRVMSVTLMAFGVNAICAYPVGQLADHMGERFTFVVLASGCMAVMVAGYLATRTAAFRGSVGPRIVHEPMTAAAREARAARAAARPTAARRSD